VRSGIEVDHHFSKMSGTLQKPVSIKGSVKGECAIDDGLDTRRCYRTNRVNEVCC
jgi:hypothetical protein